MQLAALVVLGVGSSGLLLAVVGWFTPVPAIALALAAVTLLVLATRPRPASTEAGPSSTSTRLAAAVALGIIGLVTVANAAAHGEHLIVDRDPGVYVTTARWLADEGELLVATPDDPFTRHEQSVRSDLGFHPVDDRPDAPRAPQFAHLLAVLMAWGHWIGGASGLLVVPALLGAVALATIWSFAARMLRPWTATAATAALALSPVQAFFSRDAYSEPLTQLLVFAGLVALLDAVAARPGVDGRRPRSVVATGAVAGLLLGATLQARIDGVGLLILLPLWVALVVRAAEPSARGRLVRVVGATAAGALGSMALGLVDLAWRSPVYLERLTPELAALLAALAATVVLGVVAVRVADQNPAWWEWLRDRAGTAGAAASGLVIALAAIGWFVRPRVSTVRGDESSFIAAIQQREGSTVDPTLRYAEHSLEWLSWYLGPVAVALGVVGVAVALWRLGRRFEPAAPMLLVAAGLGVSVLYLWRPSISPDHLWAMRRYLVVTIPMLVLLAAWTLDVLAARLGPIRDRATTVAPSLAALVLVLPALVVAWPLRDARAHPGLLAAVESVCDEVGPDGAIGVIPEDNLGLTAPLALQAWCGVPAAVVPVGLGVEGWESLAGEWAAEGRQLHAVARTPGALGLVGVAPVLVAEAEGPEVEATLTRRPSGTVERTTTLAVGPVALSS